MGRQMLKLLMVTGSTSPSSWRLDVSPDSCCECEGGRGGGGRGGREVCIGVGMCVDVVSHTVQAKLSGIEDGHGCA